MKRGVRDYLHSGEDIYTGGELLPICAMNNTVDNKGENTMANALRRFLPKTISIDVLVGYFYFSGFREVYRDIADKKMRILVGMDIDEHLIPTLARKQPHDLYNIKSSQKNPSNIEEEDKYFRSLALIFNDTDWFEDTESLTAFKVFVSKIADGTLEIKKSIQDRHDKLFVFHYTGLSNTDTGVSITGSSNLSYQGMVARSERNKIDEGQENFINDSQYFEECWMDSENITIADSHTKELFIKRIQETLWLYQKPSPYHLYIRILKEIFTLDVTETDIKTPSQITHKKFSDFRYQLDAIRFGIDKIIKYNGVIIADVV
jgi:hypothetical protein